MIFASGGSSCLAPVQLVPEEGVVGKTEVPVFLTRRD